MTDGLTEKDRSGLRSALEASPKVRRAVLFGSRAMGSFRGASDVDLAIEGEDFGWRDLLKLNARIAKLNLPLDVDLVIRATIKNHELEKHIQEHGREWYRKKSRMGSEWKAGTLGDIAEIVMGQSPTGETCNETGEGVPLLNGPTEFGGHHPRPVQFTSDPRKFAEPGDLLFCVRGSTTGRMNWADQRYAVGRGLAAIRPKQGKDYRHFVRAVIDANLGRLLASATGSTFPNVSREQIQEIKCLIPPSAEQKAIASVLGALDDKIELNRRMNGTLESMARALFQSWFVDFDPVRSRLDGEIHPGLAEATASLFPDHFADNGHDKLPARWHYAAIAKICAINAWTLAKNDELATLEYVEISEVSRGSIEEIAKYPRGQEPSRARRRLRHGDTVLSTVRPDRGSYFIALKPPLNRVVSTGFAVLTPTEVPWSFIHAAMTRPEVSEHLGQMADGGAYPAVRPETIGAWNVALPDEPQILDAFHLACAPLYELAETNRTQSRTLAALRDILLPKLLRGKLETSALRDLSGMVGIGLEKTTYLNAVEHTRS